MGHSSASQSVPSRAPVTTARAWDILGAVGIMENPYLVALEDGSMPLEVFRASQEHFSFAVSFFPRPMAALAGRIPDALTRFDILHNLVEEHGHFDERRCHHHTFRRFLATLGADLDRLDGLTPPPAVCAFNSVLAAACALDELEVGAACMGIVELAFAPISARLGQAVVARGWVRRKDLVHYRLHAKIDERHAEEFFAIAEPRFGDPARRPHIEKGLALGAYVFDRLYRDLAETAGRTSERAASRRAAPLNCGTARRRPRSASCSA